MANFALGRSPVDGIDYVDGDALVVHLCGHLDPAALLRFLGTLTLDRPWVVLDLFLVTELDPSILAILTGAQRRLRPHGYRIALWRLRTQPLQLVNDRGFSGAIDVVDGDLRCWLSDRRRGGLTIPPADSDLAPAEHWTHLLSSRVVTGLGTMTGEPAPVRRSAR